MKWKSGFLAGLQKQSMILISLLRGSQNQDMKKLLSDQSQNLTGIGLIMLQEHKLDAFLVLLSLESFQLRTSILDAGYHTSGWCSLFQKVLEEDSDIKDHWLSTVINSITELLWTIQISFGGTWQEFFQRTHQFQTLIENGEQDKLQSSINTTRPVTDTGSESQDMFLGMVLKTNQSCHILLIKAVMLSMVPSRETATLPPLLSDKVVFQK